MVFSVWTQVLVSQDNGKQEIITGSPKKEFGKFPIVKVIGVENLTHWELQNVSGWLSRVPLIPKPSAPKPGFRKKNKAN